MRTILLSTVVLALSFGAEHYLGIKPCELCLYQRKVWVILLILGIVGVRFSLSRKIVPLVVLTGIVLSLYHLGMINGLVEDRCQYKKAKTMAEYRILLKKGPNPSCSKSDWDPIGMPASVWNIVFLLVVLFFKKNTNKKISEITIDLRQFRKSGFLL